MQTLELYTLTQYFNLFLFPSHMVFGHSRLETRQNVQTVECFYLGCSVAFFIIINGFF